MKLVVNEKDTDTKIVCLGQEDDQLIAVELVSGGDDSFLVNDYIKVTKDYK